MVCERFGHLKHLMGEFTCGSHDEGTWMSVPGGGPIPFFVFEFLNERKQVCQGFPGTGVGGEEHVTSTHHFRHRHGLYFGGLVYVHFSQCIQEFLTHAEFFEGSCVSRRISSDPMLLPSCMQDPFPREPVSFLLDPRRTTDHSAFPSVCVRRHLHRRRWLVRHSTRLRPSTPPPNPEPYPGAGRRRIWYRWHRNGRVVGRFATAWTREPTSLHHDPTKNRRNEKKKEQWIESRQSEKTGGRQDTARGRCC